MASEKSWVFIGLRVRPDLHQQMQQIAGRYGLTVAEFARLACHILVRTPVDPSEMAHQIGLMRYAFWRTERVGRRPWNGPPGIRNAYRRVARPVARRSPMSDKPDVEQLIERLRAAALDMFHIHDSPSGRQTDRGMAVYLDAAERIIREWASEQPPAWVPVSERLPTIEDAGRAGCVIGGDGDGVMLCASKHDGTWGWMREESHITHWMPLPAPPQAAGADTRP